MSIPMPARVRAILSDIAEQHGLTVDDIIGQGRTRRISTARQAAYHALFTTPTPMGTPPSLTIIGAWTGRHHTSVAHGITRFLNPENTRPTNIAVKAHRHHQPMSNVRSVSPEVQAEVLTRWAAQQAAEAG